MFGLGKKNKVAHEIDRLLGVLEEDPEDTKSRLTLANLYVQAGDQETAIKEYREAAKQLCAEGWDLEPIAVYKKILSLDGFSVPERSRAAIEEADALLAKAKEAYEKVFQMESQYEETVKTPALREGKSDTTRDDFDGDEAIKANDLESVPPEMVLDLPQDEAASEREPHEEPESLFPDQQFSAREAPPSERSTGFDGDARDQEILGLQDKVLFPSEQAQGERGAHGTGDEPEMTLEVDSSEADSSHLPRDLHIDVNRVQIDDDLETMLSEHENEPSGQDPLSLQNPETPVDEDRSDVQSVVQEPSSHEESSGPGATETTPQGSVKEDFDLHYNLGIACYEMELIDKAIEEFAKAHEQGIKTVESLFMLARCYSKKGLYDKAADYIGEALSLDNLTQEQIDALNSQLERIRTEADSDPSLAQDDSPE